MLCRPVQKSQLMLSEVSQLQALNKVEKYTRPLSAHSQGVNNHT